MGSHIAGSVLQVLRAGHPTLTSQGGCTPTRHPVALALPHCAAGAGIREYLDDTIVPVLRLGLRELVKQR